MKLIEKISWLMGRVQKTLFPHLNQCMSRPLTPQEERLVSILELIRDEFRGQHIELIPPPLPSTPTTTTSPQTLPAQ